MEVDWALERDETMAHESVAHLLEARFRLGVSSGDNFEVRYRVVSWPYFHLGDTTDRSRLESMRN